MKIHLHVSGGMGIVLDGTLDIAELPQGIARRIRKMLVPEKLTCVVNSLEHPFRTEVQCFRLGIVREGKCSEAFEFSESQCSPELLNLMQELVSALRTKYIRNIS